jgi:hypothetical protein
MDAAIPRLILHDVSTYWPDLNKGGFLVSCNSDRSPVLLMISIAELGKALPVNPQILE